MLARRDQDVLGDAAVFGGDEPDAVLAVDASDQAAVFALQHLDDRAFGAAAVVAALEAHCDAVAVQDLVHLARRQPNVGTAVVGDAKAEAVGVAIDTPGDQVELVHQADRALAVAQDLAVALHGRQPSAKHVEFGRGDVQQLGQLHLAQGHALLAQSVQNELATGQGVVVALALPRQMRVLRAA